MKKLILTSLLLLASDSFAFSLWNFSQIKSEIMSGKSIHIVTDFAKCSDYKKSSRQSAIASAFNPTELLVTGDRISASLMHFTLDNPAFPNWPVYEFVKYTFASDNHLKVTYQILDARNYSSLAAKMIFDCKIDEGAKVYT